MRDDSRKRLCGFYVGKQGGDPLQVEVDALKFSLLLLGG